MDNEEKLCSIIMTGNKYARFVAVCDKNAQILWEGHHNEVDNILTLEETKLSLKRSIDAWGRRDEFNDKLGDGRYAIVRYKKIKRVTIPLKSGHLLFVSIQGDKPGYIEDLIKIVDQIELHSPVLPEEFVKEIEKELNKISESIPDFLKNNFEELSTFWSYTNPSEFFVGMTAGICEVGYCQSFSQKYEKSPSNKQITEIRKIIARRKVQIKQGIDAYYKEKNKILCRIKLERIFAT